MGNVLFVYERPGVRLHVQREAYGLTLHGKPIGRHGVHHRSTLHLQRMDGSWTEGNTCAAASMRGATLPLMICLDASAHRWLLDLIEEHERCDARMEARHAAC